MRILVIASVLLFALIACQTQYKVRKLVSKIDYVDEVSHLKEKYPKLNVVIHELDSVSLSNHQVYSRLTPGQLFQIGRQGDEADLYKLLSPTRSENAPSDSAKLFYVLQIHLNQ